MTIQNPNSSPDMSSSNYYTTLEVAKMLGMAVRSIQLMVDRGDLQAWKTPGGHRRITRESLERWLAGTRSGVSASQGPKLEGGRGRRRGAAVHYPRVLLIEDSSHFQNLVSMLVKQKFPGVDLHIANDGITGLVSFGQLQPDLIIVDILLPGIDGATMITGLKRHALFGNCKLIVLTSLDQEQRAPYAFALQDVPVVHKPRLVNELPGLIEDALKPLLRPQDLAGNEAVNA
jgi:excisionase family DNA binding protein